MSCIDPLYELTMSGLLDYSAGDGPGPLAGLLRDGGLTSVFQPIVTLQDGAIHAHEALVRGPVGSPLHRPDQLLRAAREEGLLRDFEIACVGTALANWTAMGQQGRLFVNISAAALVRSFACWPAALLSTRLEQFGLRPGMVVFEITEHERVDDVAALVAVTDELHAAGVSIALDDFGDGRSSLRLWSELSPEIVKIDKYFTGQVAQQAKKLKTIRGLMDIAETFGTALVAEGVETAEDLRALRDVGVAYGQGYFLGRPASEAMATLPAGAAEVLADRRIAVLPTLRVAPSPGRVSRATVMAADPVAPATPNQAVFNRFMHEPELHAVAVVDHERPVGLIGRQAFLNRYSKPFAAEIYGRRPCVEFASTVPTVIEVDADVPVLMAVLTSADQRYLTDGFIYTENGAYRGLGTGHQLVRQVTESRLEAARHANPLTLLPGNIPITLHIDRLLQAGGRFVACYADLNKFKPFNDYYGYWRGDEMIKLLASVLMQHCDPQRDFVGHVGGDDFVVLFQSDDWEPRCRRMVQAFDAAAMQLYDEEARRAGGIEAEDRDGVRRRFGFTTLTLGVVPVQGERIYRSAADVANAAARAKQQAKSRGQACCVIAPEQSVPAKGTAQAGIAQAA